MNNKTKIGIIKGFSALAIYFIASFTNLNVLILKILNIQYQNWSDSGIYAYLILYQLFIVSIIVILFEDIYIKHFLKFTKSFKKYITTYIKYWFISLGLMIISNIIIGMIANGIAPNEQAVRETLHLKPLYTFIASVIIAPFLEESLFRLAIKEIIPKNKIAFIMVSGISFGLLHIIGNVNVWTDILYIVPYSIPGLIFAYTLVKSNNIFVPISLHTIHNGILVTIQLLSLL